MSIDLTNPYVGLRPFYGEESLLLFGRDEQTLELLQRLHEHHFVAVVGSSGCGKSSLLRAGLIPSLKGGYLVDESNEWMISIMKPGQRPLYNLAESILKEINPEVNSEEVSELVKNIEEEGIDAILDILIPIRTANKTNFFLLVDQFEELFRFSMEKKDISRKDEAIDFVNILLELSTQEIIPLYIVFTMRSDFIGDCAQFHGLPEAMNKSQYLVPRLNRRQLKLVIEGPARLYGGNFSSALTSKLLNKLGQVQDELPLLQHILMRIWDYEEQTDKSGELDIEDYNNVGGLEKALSNHADEAADGMTEREKDISKEMFKALTAIDENGRKIRRPLLLSDLKELTGATDAELDEVIDHFIRDKRSFLIIEKSGDSGDKVIDISHESLIRQWNTLGEWVEEEAESASYYLQLSEATRLNKLKKKDYLTGSELQIALDWKNKFKPTATWANRYKEGFDDCMSYLDDSEYEFNQEILKEKRRKQHKKITQIFILGLVGLVVGIFLYMGWDEKQRNKAFDTFFTGRELISDDPTKALDSMMTAIKMYDIELFKEIASSTYDKHELYEEVITGKPDNNSPIKFSNDTTPKFIVNNQKTNFLRSVHIETGETKDSIVFNQSIVSANYIPSNNQYLVTFEDGSLSLMDKKGNVTQQFDGNQKLGSGVNARVNSISFNQDNSKLVTGYENGHIIIWDFDGNQLYSNTCHDGRIISAILSPDEQYILSASWDDTVKLLDIDTKTCEVLISSQQINSLNFSSDGQKIVVGSNQGYAYIRDLKGSKNDTLTTGTIPIYTVDFSHDDSHALTVNSDGALTLWDVSESRNKFKFPDVIAVDSKFTDNGNSLIVQDFDGQYSLFDYEGNLLKSFGDLVAPPSHFSISFDAGIYTELFKDGYAMLYDGKDKKAKFSDIPLNYYGESPTLNFTPDRKHVYGFNTSYSSIILHSWDVKSGIKSPDIPEFNMEEITAYEISPTKGLDEIIIAGYSGQLVLFKKIVSGGYEEKKINYSIKGLNKSQQNYITSLAFSSSGDKLLCGHASGLITLIDLNSGKKTRIDGHSRQINKLVFSPSGTSFLSASLDKTIIKRNISNEIDASYYIAATFSGNTSPINELKYSKDERHIISGSSDGRILLWDMNGTIIKEFKGHNGEPITSIYFDNVNGKILSGSQDGTVRSWDWLDNYESLSENSYSYADMNSLKIKNDSLIIVTYFDDEKVKEFDIKKKELISVNGKKDSLNYVANYLLDSISFGQKNRFFISPSGNNYVLYKKDNAFEVKELFDGETVKHDSIGQWGAATFSSSSNKFAIGTTDGNINLLDVNTSEFEKFKPINKLGDVFYSQIVFSPDENNVAYSIERDTVLYTYDLNLKDRKRFKGPSVVSAMNFSNDGLLIANGTVDGKVLVWDKTDNDEPLLKLESEHFKDQEITVLEFSSDGSLLFAGSNYGKSLIWKINRDDDDEEDYTATVMQFIPSQPGELPLIDAEFTTGNETIITGSGYGVINIYNINERDTFAQKFNDFLEKSKDK